MHYEKAMAAAKLGSVARRVGWLGHIKVEGLRCIRVEPNKRPRPFYATTKDKRASDWEVSNGAAVSDILA